MTLTFWKMLALVTMAGCLAACGGAEGDSPASLLKALKLREQALATPAMLPGTEGRVRAMAVQGTIGPELLLDWAELSYASLFPKGASTQRLVYAGVAYTVRYYATTGNYLGITDDGGVWGYGPFTGNSLRSYGKMADYTCLVSPKLCEQPAAVCRTEIASGFTGDLNATYPDAGGSSDGGSADGGGADGGSAGVGGSEGKVLGGRIRVIRLADGAVLGEGTTDSTRGLATVRWCKADMPVLLELRGAPGAKYYDEAVNDLIEFPLTQRLRALVDRFDENVGVSALTEAAYLYAMNNIVNDPVPIRSGAKPLVTDGVPVGMTAVQVSEANQFVLGRMNGFFTNGLKQSSVKTLATPIDQSSGRNVLPRNRYGRYAALTGSFAKVAREYYFDSTAPALSFANQIAADLTDGMVNNRQLDGRSTVASGRRTFDPYSASERWTLGMGKMSERFGMDLVAADGEYYVRDTETLVPHDDPRCKDRFQFEYFYLSKFGAITRKYLKAPAGDCAVSSTDSNAYGFEFDFLTDAVALETAEFRTRNFAISNIGEVWGWGSNYCGALGTGDPVDAYARKPVKVPKLEHVVTIQRSRADDGVIALTASGDLFSWGLSSSKVGHPPSAFTVQCPPRTVSPPGPAFSSQRAIVTPRLIDGLPPVNSISMTANIVAAVTLDGNLYQWGIGFLEGTYDSQGWTRSIGLSDVPRKMQVPEPLSKVVGKFDFQWALSNSGAVWGWGFNYEHVYDSNYRDDANIVWPPKAVVGVERAIDVSAEDALALALLADGSVMSFRPSQVAVRVTGGRCRAGEIFDPEVGLRPVYEVIPKAARLYKGGFIGDNGKYYYSYGIDGEDVYGDGVVWGCMMTFQDVLQP